MTQSNKEIILKITNDKIWFNEIDYINISYTNIPHQSLKFNSFREIYWQVEMIGFEHETNKLFLKINNYLTGDLASFLNQTPKKTISYLDFGKFNWIYLEPLLSMYTKSEFIDQLTNASLKQKSNIEKKESAITNIKILEYPLNQAKPDQETNNLNGQIKSVIEDEYAIDFNDSIFMLGYVLFSKHIKSLNQTVDFKIVNPHILSEFDNIKYWFSKKLKSKKFKSTNNHSSIGSKNFRSSCNFK